MSSLIPCTYQAGDFFAIAYSNQRLVRVSCREAGTAAVEYVNCLWITDADEADAVANDWSMFGVQCSELRISVGHCIADTPAKGR